MKRSEAILSILFLSLILSVSLVSAGFFEDFLNLFKPTPNFSPPSNGLIASYALDGNANDNSGNNNHGSISGAQSISVGKSGSAYSLDGNDRIILRDLDTDYITVAGWFYFNSTTPEVTRAITKWTETTAFGQTQQQISWKLGTSNKTEYNFLIGTNDEIRAPVLQSGRWVHLAATFDGSTMRLYVNGILEAEKNKGGVLEKNNARIIIGSNEQMDNFMHGGVDEVYIYNRGLTSSEVKQLYESTKVRFGTFPSSFNPTAGFYKELSSKGTILIATDGRVTTGIDGINYNPNANSPGSPSGWLSGTDSLFLTSVAYYPGGPANNTRLFGTINNVPATYYNGVVTPQYTLASSYPLSAKAVEGYTDLFNNIDRAHVVFTQDNKVYTFNVTSNSWVSTSLSSDASTKGYPNQLPKAAYFYKFSNCRSPGPFGDVNNDRVVNTTDVIIVNTMISQGNNLKGGCADMNGDGTVTLSDRDIITHYSFGVNGFSQTNTEASNAGIHYWFDVNGQAKLYEYKGRGNFVEKTIPSGLPRFIAPDLGYYDSLTNNIILWYGANAYASPNGQTFSLVYGSGVPGCFDNTDCPSNQICNANNQCIPSCTTSPNVCGPLEICSTTTGTCTPVQCTPTNLANCGSASSQIVCDGNARSNRTITPSCTNNNCLSVTNFQVIENCPFGCTQQTSGAVCNNACTPTNLNNCQPASSVLVCQLNTTVNKQQVVNVTTTPTCPSGSCQSSAVSILGPICDHGCSNGACQPQCTSNSQCTGAGEVCTNGACVQDTCSPTDPCPSGFYCSSQNICLAGSLCIDNDVGTNASSTLSNVSYGDGTLGYVDSCQNATNLLEAVCNVNTNIAEQQTIVCPNGCSNGACQGTQPTITCVDSDNGKNYTLKGSVNLTTGGSSISGNDVCTNNNYLKEYYCENNQIASESKFCDLGCSDAACETDDDDSSSGGGGSSSNACNAGEEKCGIGNNRYYTCINRVWSQPNLIPGKCGYESQQTTTTNPNNNFDCTDDFDCNDDEICNSDNECQVLSSVKGSDGGIWKIVMFTLGALILIVAAIIIYLKVKRINSKQNHSVTMIGRRPGYPPSPMGMNRPGFPPRPGMPPRPAPGFIPGSFPNNPNLRRV